MTWTPERLRRVEEVFLEVAELDAATRGEALAAACAGDEELASAVLRLIEADGGCEDDLIDHGLTERLHGRDPLLGQRFGAFRLQERIAEGGMGTVYRAERCDCDFGQEAAVKVLRLALSTPAMRDRFARERRTMARLVHDNVARIYDGGTSEQGVPFIAMELVDGLRIDHYCDLHAVDVDRRLRLFVEVCRVVQYAHQNLVLHLDLKPSNILIDARGVPKLVDFGVARLLDSGDIGEAADVVTRSRACTPEYASPEQLRGEPLTTAADVYSLGAVLFNLLTGRRAFSAAGSELEHLRMVCEQEPDRPSSLFAAGGAARPDGVSAADHALRCRSTPAAMLRRLRGDLDRIVATAMAADVGRRYASCADLIDEIERHLGGFPVRARDADRGYRLRKFVARHRIAIGSVAAVSAALLVGIGTTLRMAQVANLERDRAAEARVAVERERDAAAQARTDAEQQRDAAATAQQRAEDEAAHARIEVTSNNLFADMLGELLLSSIRAASVEERQRHAETLQRKAAQVRRQFAAEPHVLANVLDQLGRTCTGLGAFAQAEPLLEEAAQIRRRQFGVASLEHALSLGGLGRMFYASGRHAEAVVALREAHRLHVECEHSVHTDVAGAANDLAAAETVLGNRERARELHGQALQLRRAAGDEVRIAESLNNLANAVADPREARALLEEALELRERASGSQDPLTLQTRTNLAVVCIRLADLPAASAQLMQSISGFRALGGLGDEGLAHSLCLLAQAELVAGRSEAAEAAIAEAVQVDRRRLAAESPQLAMTLEVQATVHERGGRWPEAVQAWREVVQFRERALPETHPQLLMTRCSLGGAMVRAGELAAGLQLLRDVHAALAGAAPETAPGRIDCQLHLALAEERNGDAAAAERLLLDADRRCREAPVPSRGAAVRRHLGAFYRRVGRPDEAARYAAASEQDR